MPNYSGAERFVVCSGNAERYIIISYVRVADDTESCRLFLVIVLNIFILFTINFGSAGLIPSFGSQFRLPSGWPQGLRLVDLPCFESGSRAPGNT